MQEGIKPWCDLKPQEFVEAIRNLNLRTLKFTPGADYFNTKIIELADNNLITVDTAKRLMDHLNLIRNRNRGR